MVVIPFSCVSVTVPVTLEARSGTNCLALGRLSKCAVVRSDGDRIGVMPLFGEVPHGFPAAPSSQVATIFLLLRIARKPTSSKRVPPITVHICSTGKSLAAASSSTVVLICAVSSSALAVAC